MRIQKVRILNPVWDRCASKGIVRIGEKEVLKITVAPSIQTPDEMNIFVRYIAGANFLHSRACVIRLQDADDTMRPIQIRSKMGTLDSPQSYAVANVLDNHFKARTAVIIDPSTDSMKYEGHMQKFSKSFYVVPEFRRFADRMQGYRVKKGRKGLRDEEGSSYETRIKSEYQEFWDILMRPENLSKLTEVIHKTIDTEFDFEADIGLPPVPVIDSEVMLEYTKTVNRLALGYWPADERDNATTYLILAPEAFSYPTLMKNVVDYIKTAETKFIVIKFKNLELDQRTKVDERAQMKELLETVNETKREHHDDRVFVALEAGVQAYLFAVGGFDIVSTSMTGFDGDFPFRRGNKTAINGYFDIETLLMRNERFVRMCLERGGFPHEGCVCSGVKDYESAKLDWYRIRREHFVRRMNELCADIWAHIDDQTIEECKARISRSSLSNLKHTLPYLEMV